jgi:hypothetical protein
MRQKRYPLLLDPKYPPERQVLSALSAVPDGERAGFLRALILLGHQEIERDAMRQRACQKPDSAR